ncbi:MAG TPA: hypothetical protein VFB27_02540, partial [Opitutaceae bacterium]|nr:hypothetical protein [Opitutaceae bacterium]
MKVFIRSEFVPAAATFALGTGLAALTYRRGRMLTFDGYYYCELAKGFSRSWPDRLGNHWTFGYPFLGGLAVRAGLPAYAALTAVSLIFFAILIALAGAALKPNPWRWLIISALAAAPIVGVQLFGILTELPFAAALLGLAVSLAGWPRRAALGNAAGCAVLALTLRYAGIVTVAMLACWLMVQWQELRRARRLSEAIAACLITAALMTTLIGINVYQSGHASGADRGSAPGLHTLPCQLLNLGWSAPSALFAGGLRDRLGIETLAGKLIGLAIFALITAVSACAWLRPRTSFSRPLALAAFGYLAGMGVLHCVGDFDALYNARTFLPALFPLGLLLAEQAGTRRSALLAGCVILLAGGTVAAFRGISRQVGGDVQAAIMPLRSKLTPTDTVAINDDAFSLSAYLSQPTHRAWFENWNENSTDRFLVVAAEPRDRYGDSKPLPKGWLDLCGHLVARHR